MDLGGLEQQLGRRLAVRRVGIVRRGVGMKEGVDIVALELPLHLRVDGGNLIARDKTPPHARLVADHEKQETGLSQGIERRRRFGKNFDARGIAEIGDVDHEGVVPVEKNGALFHATPWVLMNISRNSSTFSVAVPSLPTTRHASWMA